MIDPFFKSVSLLTHFEGTSGTQIFPDWNGITVPRSNGIAVLSSTQKKFGTTSLYCAGGSGYNFVTPTSSNYAFYGVDFTLECWIYPTAAGASHVALLDTGINSADIDGFGFSGSGSGSKLAFKVGGTTYGNTGTSVVTNQWQHVAFSRTSGVISAYLNGVQQWSITSPAGYSTASCGLSIGADQQNGYYYTGYIDELRVTKGVGRYTASFTPETSAFVWYRVYYTLVLMDPNWLISYYPMYETSGSTLSDSSTINVSSTSFTDSSPSPKSITPHGDVKIVSNYSKMGGASGKFNGLGDFLTVPHSTDFLFGSGNFTIEMWFRSLLTGSQFGTLCGVWNGSSGRSWEVYIGADGHIWFYWSTGGGNYFYLTFSYTYQQDTWQHLAVVRSGNTLMVFIDGVMLGSPQVLTDTFYASSEVFLIGTSDPGGGEYYKGYLDELRIVKGTAVYTSNFTPSSSEFDNSISPSILLHFNLPLNTKIPYPLTITGTPTFSQSALYSKSEDTSILFAGESASGTFKNLNGLPGFSVVFFIKTSTISQTLFSKSGVFSIAINSDGKIVFTVGANTLTGNTVITDNGSRLVGCSFDLDYLTIYLNESLDATATNSASLVDAGTQPLVLGPLTGTLDDTFFLTRSLIFDETRYLWNFTNNIVPLVQDVYDEDVFVNPGYPPPPLYFPDEDSQCESSLLDAYYSCNLLSGIYSLAPWVTISGIVTVEGIPSSRKVWLLEWYNKQVVRTTWSDSTTGAYSFNDIKSGNYFVWLHDSISGKEVSKQVTIGVPNNLDPSISSASSSINTQFFGYMDSWAIFKTTTPTQDLIDNLFYSSKIFSTGIISSTTYVNGIVAADIPVILLDKNYFLVDSTVSDVSGTYTFSGLTRSDYYVISSAVDMTNAIVGPIQPSF